MEKKKILETHEKIEVPIGRDKIRVAAYCRVSTEKEEQQNSYENQVDYYTNYISEISEYELVGIYGDEGKSGTSNKGRSGFTELITDCKAGSIDLVVTKSISRFARNTQDCLQYSRELKELGIPIWFEKERINTMDGKGEVLFTILSSLAQEESRNISENIKWAYQTQFQQGKVVVGAKRFLGFDKDSNGKLIINDGQAKIVKFIYDEFEKGYTEQSIARHLNEKAVPGIYGGAAWGISAIHNTLTSVKVMGDLLLQTTFVPDFLTKSSIDNKGERDMYYVEKDHEAIIEPDEWEAVQLELARQKEFREEHHIQFVRQTSGGKHNALAGKIICGKCNRGYTGYKQGVLRCSNRQRKSACNNPDISVEIIGEMFKQAWAILKLQKESLYPKWALAISDGTPLERLRAKQMQGLVESSIDGEMLPELMQTVIEKMVIYNETEVVFYFHDNTVINIKEKPQQLSR